MKLTEGLRGGLLAICLMTAAFPQPGYAAKVKAFTAPGATMAQYKTYQWLPTRILKNTGVVEDDPVVTPLIKEAVNREMALRGMKEVPEGADLQIATGITTHATAQLEAVVMAVGAQDLYFATPIATMGRYNRKGSLIINLIDTKTKKSAWAGIAEENLTDVQGAGLKKIGKATADLFKKYPSAK